MGNSRKGTVLTLKILELALVSSMFSLLRFGGRTEVSSLKFSSLDLNMFCTSLVGGAVLTTLLALLCHCSCSQTTQLEICLLFTQFLGFTALGTLTILSDRGTFDDPIERRTNFSVNMMDQVLGFNIKQNKDGMMLALGVLGVLSSFLFLTDLCYQIATKKAQKSLPSPTPRK